jgi:hypothetical protein
LLFRGGLPLALALAVMVTPTYAMTPAPTVQIQIQDQCNAATFNAALGGPVCSGNGAVTFQQFVAELQHLHFVPQWQFVPAHLQMVVGQSFVATNVGGETHTFTEVKNFAGGAVPFLNQLAGKTSLAPECTNGLPDPARPGFLQFAAPALASIVAPTFTFGDTEGTNDVGHPVLYQCCIHPWMNETITVRTS